MHAIFFWRKGFCVEWLMNEMLEVNASLKHIFENQFELIPETIDHDYDNHHFSC